MAQLLLALWFIVGASSAFAQFGALDETFGNGGKVITSIGSGATATCTKVQADGKIIVAGYAYINTTIDFVVIRYNDDGTPDTTFNQTGIDTFNFDGYNDLAFAAVIQPDGKIIVAGEIHNSMCLVRLNTDGLPDSTFGIDGLATVNVDSTIDLAQGVALQNNGKIVIAGTATNIANNVNAYYMVARYNNNGTLDSTFNNTGIVTTQVGNNRNKAFALAIQPDDKIIVAGEVYDSTGDEFGIFRYDSTGVLDNSFGTAGIDTIKLGKWNSLRAVLIQPDGKVLAAGLTQHADTISALALLRVNSNGMPDTTFGINGIKTIGSSVQAGFSVILQSDNKILATGYSKNGNNNDFLIVRTNSNGLPDNTFGDSGVVTTAFGSSVVANSVALQNDGKIIVAGGLPFISARYTSGLAVGIEEVPQPNSYCIYPNPVTNRQFTLVQDSYINNPNINLRMYSSTGNLIYSCEYYKQKKNIVAVPANLATGMYIISITDGSQTVQKKIIISNN